MAKLEFSFAWEGAQSPGGPWAHLQVVELRGHEELSGLYRYEITLIAKAPAPEVDPGDLVHSRATLRIATLSTPDPRMVHGVITEAEEVHSLPEGMLYRVVIMPPFVRARHRRRGRIFLEKTTRQIVEAVLTGDASMHKAGDGAAPPDDEASSYSPPLEQFTWRVSDAARIDDVSVRRSCVQYNESDLDFVARLLEEEGIAYHFENSRGVCLLVLADLDSGRARLDPWAPLGAGIPGREITSVKLGARVHAEATAERDGVKADYAMAEGSCRVLSAGSIFALEHEKARYAGEYLVTKLDVTGHQEGVLANAEGDAAKAPFTVKLECARRGKAGVVSESRFRPAPIPSPIPPSISPSTPPPIPPPIEEHRTIHVSGNNTETVDANHAQTVALNHSDTTGLNKIELIGVSSTIGVGVHRTVDVGANERIAIGGTQTLTVGGLRAETVTGPVTETYLSTQTTTVAGVVDQTYSAAHVVHVGADRTETIEGSYTQSITGDFHQTTASSGSFWTVGTRVEGTLGSLFEVSLAGKLSLSAGTLVEIAAASKVGIHMGGALDIAGAMRVSITEGPSIETSSAMKVETLGGPDVQTAPTVLKAVGLTIFV